MDLKLFKSIFIPFIFIAGIWILKLFEIVVPLDLSFMGVLPRELEGILGIFTGPLVHGSLKHLLSNSIPILVLGGFILYFYERLSLKVLPMIYMGSTILVWLFARPNNHIGASGVVYGMAAFLFFSGFLRKDRRSLGIAFLVIFLYGSMVWGVLPGRENISWESHLFGAIVGSVLAIAFRNVDRNVYEWEHEDDDEEDDDFNWDQTPFTK